MKPRYWKIAALLWATAIWLGSLAPVSGPATLQHGDKLEHLLGYAVLAWLGVKAFDRRALAWLAASLMGVAVEVAQSFTGWRWFDPIDMLANAIGAFLGVMVAHYSQRQR